MNHPSSLTHFIPILLQAPEVSFLLQKTYIHVRLCRYRALYSHLCAVGKSILCVASSGIAATLRPRVHSLRCL
jgi:hypothetical protein